ncbi:putative acyltransferase [Rhodovulum sulfidophilum]|uniref:Putative acyltransferase n=1 Tax=Rhodovulum sulfidophilum TaxID=35806 RepID=A0A0D6B8Y4_RHOSU|nr:putative acyltransferase [Rhodovulum sulfidophilum]
MPDIEWPREIWAAECGEHDADGRHVFSEHATVPRWEGDRDCAFHRYVDGDIAGSQERYFREMLAAAKARAEAAEAELDRIRAALKQEGRDDG